MLSIEPIYLLVENDTKDVTTDTLAEALENTTDDAGVAPRKNDVGLNPRKM